jgi:hypothetical protein
MRVKAELKVLERKAGGMGGPALPLSKNADT